MKINHEKLATIIDSIPPEHREAFRLIVSLGVETKEALNSNDERGDTEHVRELARQTAHAVEGFIDTFDEEY